MYYSIKPEAMKQKRGEGPLKQEMRAMRIVHQKLKTVLFARHFVTYKNHVL